jgi:hypothetical protein
MRSSRFSNDKVEGKNRVVARFDGAALFRGLNPPATP